MSNWGKWEDQIICPWCGYKDIDSWEYNDSDGRQIHCLHCDKPMKIYVDFEVRYSAQKVEENQAKSAQQNNQSSEG